MKRITKEEFIKDYCTNSKMTREYYDSRFVALQCNCGSASCRGWATIYNQKECIATHNELYGPKAKK